MKKNLLYPGMIFLVLMIGLNSCKKPMPTVEFTFEVDGSAVTFTSTVSEANVYSWDFGDGNGSSEANPTHSYAMSGSYPVSLTVTGEGGEATATAEVEILPSITEMLTGGPAATNGKTWVLSRGYTAGVDGGSAVEPTLTVLLTSEENVLDGLLLASDEYDNEFTFYSDGRYVVNPVNDSVLTASLFGLFGGEVQIHDITDNWLGLCTSTYEVPDNSTWTLHNEDFTVISAAYGATDVPAVEIPVTFSGWNWISLSQGGYFGILDFPTTRQFILKSITPEKMEVALFICGYWADPTGSGDLPYIMFHMTYVPKD